MISKAEQGYTEARAGREAKTPKLGAGREAKTYASDCCTELDRRKQEARAYECRRRMLLSAARVANYYLRWNAEFILYLRSPRWCHIIAMTSPAI